MYCSTRCSSLCGCPISCAPRGGASVVRSASAAAKAFCAVVVGTTANPNKLAVLAMLALVVVLVVAAGACECGELQLVVLAGGLGRGRACTGAPFRSW